jgi:hypothetical protein
MFNRLYLYAGGSLAVLALVIGLLMAIHANGKKQAIINARDDKIAELTQALQASRDATKEAERVNGEAYTAAANQCRQQGGAAFERGRVFGKAEGLQQCAS